jgi:O-antigen/teichoic acid export membrane protein
MGIVIRKSLITSLFSYLGVLIGYLNILYFFPKFLTPSQIGLYRLILDSAILLAPFAQSGVMQGVIKFFPVYQQKENQRDFSTFSIFSA